MPAQAGKSQRDIQVGTSQVRGPGGGGGEGYKSLELFAYVDNGRRPLKIPVSGFFWKTGRSVSVKAAFPQSVSGL